MDAAGVAHFGQLMHDSQLLNEYLAPPGLSPSSVLTSERPRPAFNSNTRKPHCLLASVLRASSARHSPAGEVILLNSLKCDISRMLELIDARDSHGLCHFVQAAKTSW